MTNVRLPIDMEKRLSDLAKETHKSKSYYIKQAVADLLDDQEDYLIALTRMDRIEKGIDIALPFEKLVEEYKRKHGSKKMEH